MASRYCIVFDFETDGLDIPTINPVQLAGVPIDLWDLTILADRVFKIDIKPESFGEADYAQAHEEVIAWHARNGGCSPTDILERWEKGTPLSHALPMFLTWCKEFNHGGPPISGGQNIINFDIPILKRICEEKGKKYPFRNSGEVDLRHLQNPWFMFSKRPPKNSRLVTLLEYFGMSADNSHDAMVDVMNTSRLIVKFLGLHKRLITKVPVLNGVEAS